jgi:cyclase
VGGWIFETQEVNKILRLGADKIIINTQAFLDPQFINDCARIYGSQCVVVSIDVKIQDNGRYEVFIDRGRRLTDMDPVTWAQKASKMGAGELFLNCIDHDGFRQGYNLDLLRKVVDSIDIPVITMGGVFTWQHLVDGVIIGGADAVAAANIFHYTEHSTKKAKTYMRSKGIDVR